MSENKYIAVSQSDFDQYGCPHCGCSTHNDKNGPLVPWMNTLDFWCSQCAGRSAILKQDLAVSTIGFSVGTEPVYYPKLKVHPLKNNI